MAVGLRRDCAGDAELEQRSGAVRLRRLLLLVAFAALGRDSANLVEVRVGGVEVAQVQAIDLAIGHFPGRPDALWRGRLSGVFIVVVRGGLELCLPLVTLDANSIEHPE